MLSSWELLTTGRGVPALLMSAAAGGVLRSRRRAYVSGYNKELSSTHCNGCGFKSRQCQTCGWCKRGPGVVLLLLLHGVEGVGSFAWSSSR